MPTSYLLDDEDEDQRLRDWLGGSSDPLAAQPLTQSQPLPAPVSASATSSPPLASASPPEVEVPVSPPPVRTDPYEPPPAPTKEPEVEDPTGQPPGTSAPAPDPYQRTAINMPPPPQPPAPPPPAPVFAGAGALPALGDLPEFARPAAPAEGDMYGDLASYAREWMDNPNRYLSDLATATRAESDLRLAEQEQEGIRGIEEWAQSRGLIGSSYEGDQRVELEGEMRRAQAEEQRAMLQMLAGAETADRAAAGGFALNTAQMQEQAQQFRSQFDLDVERAGFDAAFANAELRQSDAIQRAQIDLQAAVAGDQAAMGRVAIALDTMRAMDEALLDRTQLQLQDEEINLRAYQIQAELLMEGQRISADDARWRAELAFRQEQEAQRQSESTRDFDETQRQHDDLMDWRLGDSGVVGDGVTMDDGLRVDQDGNVTGPPSGYRGHAPFPENGTNEEKRAWWEAERTGGYR